MQINELKALAEIDDCSEKCSVRHMSLGDLGSKVWHRVAILTICLRAEQRPKRLLLWLMLLTHVFSLPAQPPPHVVGVGGMKSQTSACSSAAPPATDWLMCWQLTVLSSSP